MRSICWRCSDDVIWIALDGDPGGRAGRPVIDEHRGKLSAMDLRAGDEVTVQAPVSPAETAKDREK